MSGKETKVSGETSQGHEDGTKETGEIRGGSDEILDEVNIDEEDPVTSQDNEDVPQPSRTTVRKRIGQIFCCSDAGLDGIHETEIADIRFLFSEEPWFVRRAHGTSAVDEIGTLNSSGSSNSSYIIDISNEEVNFYTSINAVKKKFKSLEDDLVMTPHQPKIERVPLILRDNTDFNKYYKPRMVSIGPYHRGSKNLKKMEMLKVKIAKNFIQKHCLEKEVIYSKIRKEIRHLKEFYEKDAVKGLKKYELAWMFFLDGCLVLHYIYCATENKNNEDKDKKNDEDKDEFQKLDIKADCLTFIKHDLFLLENQLPYRVLELVISCIDNEEKKIEFLKSIEDFIFHSIRDQWEKHEKLNHEPPQNQGHKRLPKHLLDLLRAKILQSDKKSTKSCSIVRQYLVENMSKPLEKIKDLIEYIGKALENFPRKQTEDWRQFCRNVEELKAAGIRLKPKNTGCVTDIDFNLGTLKIHPIRVDDTTASMLLNLIAYEMTTDSPADFGISSYVAFLDSLIDRAQDVKELRDKQILRNVLGSDEEVAKLFNEICTNVVPNPLKYEVVKKNIQKRYKNTWMTAIAQLIHQYFQSPWSLIAFLAALAILALTIIQTIYAMKGYYK